MAEFLEDPSVLTKDKLKNELTAHNVPLPSGEHKKEVYVQLYLKNLTILNNKKIPPVDTFSSDEELSTPVVSNRSRSGRVSLILRLQKVRLAACYRLPADKTEPGAPTDVTTLPKADSNQNGNTNSDNYSDKEDGELWSLCCATCRRPIRGAAGRPLKPSEYWLDESRVQRTVHTESRTYAEMYSQPSSAVCSSKAPARRGFLSLLLKLLLLVLVCGSLYYAYQNLSSDQVDALKGLLDNVVIPVQSAVETAANYLGFSSSSGGSAIVAPDN
ncbi:hypothetical protein GOODEAATRI_004920 [Goodea atripinnis]|uniref:LEM-like domain-containing protein n=1 Tax=Goodea atripinnis TaxID=208336 RepID=A0ABV0N7Y2_9TELE